MTFFEFGRTLETNGFKLRKTHQEELFAFVKGDLVVLMLSSKENELKEAYIRNDMEGLSVSIPYESIGYAMCYGNTFSIRTVSGTELSFKTERV